MGYYSNLFTVPKLKLGIHHILDLKVICVFFQSQKFHMESFWSVIASFHLGDFLASVEIKDPYLHVHIFHEFFSHCSSSPTLSVSGSPFGLSSAHYVHQSSSPCACLVTLSGHVYCGIYDRPPVEEVSTSVDITNPTTVRLDPEPSLVSAQAKFCHR